MDSLIEIQRKLLSSAASIGKIILKQNGVHAPRKANFTFLYCF